MWGFFLRKKKRASQQSIEWLSLNALLKPLVFLRDAYEIFTMNTWPVIVSCLHLLSDTLCRELESILTPLTGKWYDELSTHSTLRRSIQRLRQSLPKLRSSVTLQEGGTACGESSVKWVLPKRSEMMGTYSKNWTGWKRRGTTVRWWAPTISHSGDKLPWLQLTGSLPL